MYNGCIPKGWEDNTMQELMRERLKEAGIDVTAALERFMGNETLLERFLKKFLDDTNYEKLAAAIDAGQQEAALTAAHTLKGISGNLSMTGLFALLTEQVAAFRDNDWDRAVELMPEIAKHYETISAAIKTLA